MLPLSALPDTLAAGASRTALLATPFHADLAGGTALFAAHGGPDAFDWDHPVAWLFADASHAVIHRSLASDSRQLFAARNTSPAGTTEHSTHVVTAARLLPSGEMQTTFLPIPRHLAVRHCDDAEVSLAFECSPAPGETRPTRFDVLLDTTGTDEPTAVIATCPHSTQRHDVHVVLATPARPCRLAVRAATDTHVGPRSRTLALVAPSNPTPPQLLS